MNHFRFLAAALIAIVPTNVARIFLYRILLGYRITRASRISPLALLVGREVYIDGASIGPLNVISVHILHMAPGAIIGKLNVIRKLKSVRLAEDAYILHRNFIGGTFNTTVESGHEELELGRAAQISLACFFDLSDRITLGANAVIGGSGTQFWTHGFDHLRRRSVAPISVGNNVFIGAASTVVQGVSICDDVIIGAGTVVHRNIEKPGLYVSNNLHRIGG